MSTPRTEMEATETLPSVWPPTKNDPEGTAYLLKLYAPNQGEVNLVGSGEELIALYRRIHRALRAEGLVI